jgi:hypothetical protein
MALILAQMILFLLPPPDNDDDDDDNNNNNYKVCESKIDTGNNNGGDWNNFHITRQYLSNIAGKHKIK